jgi:hypothetical protein
MRLLSRRTMARLALGAPLAAAGAAIGRLGEALAPRPAAAQEAAPDLEPTPLARFLAKQEADLTSEEKKRLRRDITQLEQSLKEIRDFTLDNDVPPSGTFRALRSKRA